ncbi:hypothetical protein IJT93_08055 [bacterium]|nr:hypothetical protein [bacterium]
MKNKLGFVIAIALFLLLAGGAGFYFGYWRNTPIYSLSLAKNAIEVHDCAEFQRRIDLDTLLSYAYDDITDSAIDKAVSSVPVLGAIFGRDLAKGAADIAKGKVVELCRRQIMDYVERGSGGVKKKESPFGMNINFAVLDSIVLGGSVVEYTHIEGDTAKIGVKLYPRNLTDGFVFQLEMQKFHGVWRLTRITNLRAFCDTLGGAKGDGAERPD